jgi:hypothetical protein
VEKVVSRSVKSYCQGWEFKGYLYLVSPILLDGVPILIADEAVVFVVPLLPFHRPRGGLRKGGEGVRSETRNVVLDVISETAEAALVFGGEHHVLLLVELGQVVDQTKGDNTAIPTGIEISNRNPLTIVKTYWRSGCCLENAHEVCCL